MGMYDTFGNTDNQLKIFGFPIYRFDKNKYLYCKERGKPYCFAGTVGGALRHFPVGTKVPWRSACYNYGKDFLAIYIGMDYRVEIYEFRGGKFLRVTEFWPNFDEVDWNQFSGVEKYPLITSYGELLETVRSVETLREYAEGVVTYYKELVNSRDMFQHSRRLLDDYKKKLGDNDDALELYSEASFELSGIRTKIDERAKEQLVMRFYEHSDQVKRIEELERVGVYLELVSRELIAKDDRTEEEELKKEALFAEAKEYFRSKDVTENEYYIWNQPLKRERKWMQEAFDVVFS